MLRRFARPGRIPRRKIPRRRPIAPARLACALAAAGWLAAAPGRAQGAPPAPGAGGDSDRPGAAPIPLPEVEIVSDPLAASGRARAAQSTVVDAARFAGEARSVAELLATAPGVTLRQTGPGQESMLSLRGASADQSLVLLDGIPLQGPGGGAIDLSTLPASLLSQLVVSRGVLGAQLGAGALGGAVEVVPKRAAPGPPQLGLELSGGSFGTARLAADASTTSDRVGAWSAGVQLDRTGGSFAYARQLTPEVAGAPWYQEERQNADAQRASALVRGAVPVKDGVELDLLLQATAGERGLPGAESAPTPGARAADQGGLFGARLRALAGGAVITGRAWVRGSRLELRGLGQGFGDCASGLDSPACAPQQSHTLGARGETEVGMPLTAAHWVTASLSAGGEWLAGDHTGIHRRAVASLALADDAALLSGALSLHPALRLDLVGEGGAVSPGLGAVVRPFTGALEPLELRANAGASFRPPSFSELYLDQGPAQPNPDLRPERAWSADAGVAWRGDWFTAAASAFWSRYTDLIVYELYPPARAKPFNFGAARIAGAELQLVARLPLGATAEVAYSLLDAVNERDSATQGGQKLAYRPPHRLFARVARRGDRLEGFVQADATSEMPRNQYGTATLPAQLRLDAGFGVRVAGPVWVDLEARNLLDDQTQQDLFQYPLPGFSLLASARARF